MRIIEVVSIDAITIDAVCRNIHASCRDAGWWKPEDVGDKHVLGTKIALIHSEVSEMLEGLRKNLPDDHLPEESMEGVEAADIFIRLADYCGARGINLGSLVAKKLAYNAQRADHKLGAREAEHGKKF